MLLQKVLASLLTPCVQTMAKVMLTCSGTTDSVYKCVSITATANAYAEATVDAHASAVANAVNACGCLTDAVSQGMNSADVYVKLVAEAASTATAEVCVTGAFVFALMDAVPPHCCMWSSECIIYATLFLLTSGLRV